MNKILMILGVVILVAIGGVLLFSATQSNNQPVQQGVEETQPPTQFDSGNIEPTESGQQSRNIKKFTIESKGLNFTPNEIEVNVGDKVIIVYKNTLGTHDWTLDEFGVKTPLINAGEIGTVEFVADKTGSFEFYCSVPGHREAGMKGTLIVQ